MAGFNKVILAGNLTKAPELRYTPSGTAITEVRLAVTTKKKSGNETLFIDVTAWERQAENICTYLVKGSSILVEGRLKMDEWKDRDTGQTRTKVSVTAQNVQFLGGSQASNQSQANNQAPQGNYHSQPQAGQQNQYQGQAQAQSQYHANNQAQPPAANAPAQQDHYQSNLNNDDVPF